MPGTLEAPKSNLHKDPDLIRQIQHKINFYKLNQALKKAHVNHKKVENNIVPLQVQALGITEQSFDVKFQFNEGERYLLFSQNRIEGGEEIPDFQEVYLTSNNHEVTHSIFIPYFEACGGKATRQTSIVNEMIVHGASIGMFDEFGVKFKDFVSNTDLILSHVRAMLIAIESENGSPSAEFLDSVSFLRHTNLSKQPQSFIEQWKKHDPNYLESFGSLLKIVSQVSTWTKKEVDSDSFLPSLIKQSTDLLKNWLAEPSETVTSIIYNELRVAVFKYVSDKVFFKQNIDFEELKNTLLAVTTNNKYGIHFDTSEVENIVLLTLKKYFSGSKKDGSGYEANLINRFELSIKLAHELVALNSKNLHDPTLDEELNLEARFRFQYSLENKKPLNSLAPINALIEGLPKMYT
jgi:hypothetical protein